MKIKFPSAPGRLKYLYLLLAVLLVSGLTFGTMFVCGREDQKQKEETVCIQPLYIIDEPSDWDKYPQSLIDNCPDIFQVMPPIDLLELQKEEEDQKEEILCPEPIYVIEEPSDWDKYPQSLIDNCPQIFEDWTGFDLEISEFDE